MKLFKKGTEKPIEIFIALFIILAVSMVMLKMFKGQIGEKTQQMTAENQKYELEQAIDEVKMLCQQKCTAASQSGCSAQKIAAYCTHRVVMDENKPDLGIDWNGDGETGVADKEFGGIQVCEDEIYCPLITECTCGKDLTMEYCIEKACQYWDEMGKNATKLLNNMYPFSTGEVSEQCQSSTGYNEDFLRYTSLPKNCSMYIN